MTWKEFILNAAKCKLHSLNDPVGAKPIFVNKTSFTPMKSPSPADDNYKMPEGASKKEIKQLAGTPDKLQEEL